MPPALRAGDRLLLLTPAVERQARRAARFPARPGRQAQGTDRAYWGCGEITPAGQPVVIDLATMKPGAASPFGVLPDVRTMTPPSTASHATYGEWPNSRGGTRVPGGGSLIGDHVVQGNYTPEMRFAVAAGNDFLAPLAPAEGTLASGAVKVKARARQCARLSAVGYRCQGGRHHRDVDVEHGAHARDGASRLFLNRAISRASSSNACVAPAPAVTECAVPTAVATTAESAMLMMTAYGPEANYGSPREAPAGWSVGAAYPGEAYEPARGRSRRDDGGRGRRGCARR